MELNERCGRKAQCEAALAAWPRAKRLVAYSKNATLVLSRRLAIKWDSARCMRQELMSVSAVRELARKLAGGAEMGVAERANWG